MNYRVVNIEKEMNDFQDKVEEACALHLMDLMANHTRRTGELKITPSYHTKRFADGRTTRFGASVAATCAEASNGH